MEVISSLQLFAITAFYQIGTTIVFGFAAGAGRDAWISVLISTAIGILIIIGYISLMSSYPGLTLVEWFPLEFGPVLGNLIAWLYPLLFLYDVGRIVADLKFLIPEITSSRMDPAIVLVGLILLVISYGLFNGIEVLARLSELLLPLIFFVFLIEIILLSSSKILNIKNLQPILGEGYARVWSTVFPLGITQSYAQTLELAMIWPLVDEPKKIMKVTVIATFISGIMITIFDVLAVLGLGEYLFKTSAYPLYLLIQQINIGDFISNLDIIGILYLSLTSFFKLFIHSFVAVRSIQKLLYINNSRILIFPVLIIGLYLGITMAESRMEHLHVAKEVFPYNLWIPLFLILPLILLIINLIKKVLNKS